MKTIKQAALGLLITCSVIAVLGCAAKPGGISGAPSNSPAAAFSPGAVAKSGPVTLPVLDALLSDEAFKTELRARAKLTDEQLSQLQKIAGTDVAKLRELDAVNQAEQSGRADQLREHTAQAIRTIIGEQKTEQLFALATEYAASEPGKFGETASAVPEFIMLAGPNAVPADTRVVVNIPAFRMDVFKDGSLLKSYRIGIGYPAFPLPRGLRKAETIIFNPTWTPPNEPWVAGMKNVSVGEAVPAGSKLNPLGPIKIPIGGPSLIHGGKPLAKIGTFASHGCVGLTNGQVQDFSRVLAEAAGIEITDSTIKSYFANRTRTRVVKLDRVVPVELRYETIVLEDGELHIYRDVYNQDTNTEANLRAVLELNGVKLEDLGETERSEVLDAVNAMSLHPAKRTIPDNTTKPSAASANPTASPVSSASPTAGNEGDKQIAATPGRKLISKNQKEAIVELAALKGKGYPPAMNLDTGSRTPATAAIAKSTTSKLR